MYLYVRRLSMSIFVLSFYDVCKLIKYAYEIALYVCNKVTFNGVYLEVASL